MLHKVLAWSEKHPIPTAIGVVVIGLIILYLLGFFTPSQPASTASTGGSLDADYLSASAAQAEAGDALQATQINANAATIQNQANDTATLGVQTQWANAAEDESTNSTTAATTASNDAAQVALGQSNNALVTSENSDNLAATQNFDSLLSEELNITGGSGSFNIASPSGNYGAQANDSGVNFAASSAAELAAQGFSAGQIHNFGA